MAEQIGGMVIAHPWISGAAVIAWCLALIFERASAIDYRFVDWNDTDDDGQDDRDEEEAE